jgi:hypothetical protein
MDAFAFTTATGAWLAIATAALGLAHAAKVSDQQARAALDRLGLSGLR